MMILFVLSAVSALVAGSIAYSRTGSNGAFAGMFILGALLPLVGIVGAFLVKPPAPAGWYGDPWRQAAWRWHDGHQWTGYTG